MTMARDVCWPLEANDERQLQHRYMQIEGMVELATPGHEPPTPPITPKAA